MGYCLLCETEIMPKITWASLFTAPEVAVICSPCEKLFQKIEGNICKICGRLSEEEVCYDCLRWNEDVEWKGLLKRNIALYAYNDSMKDVMARWKFRGDVVLVQIFQKQIEEVWKQISKEIDMIVPVPLSEERLYERGFNQAVETAKLFPHPYTEVLSRVHSEKQSKKSRQNRIKSENVFVCDDGESVKGKNILLVDDIYTTGTTLRHAAAIMKACSAENILSFTIAR